MKKEEDITDWIKLHDGKTKEEIRAILEKLIDETPEFEDKINEPAGEEHLTT